MATNDSASASRPAARGRRLTGFALAAAAAVALAAGLLGAARTSAPVDPRVSTGLAWHNDLASAQAEALSGNKKILVNIYASWCGWCRKLDQTVFSSEEFHDLSQRFVLLKLDIDRDQDGPKIRTRYRASGVPITLVLTPDLDKVLTISGYLPRDRFLDRIGRAVEDSDGTPVAAGESDAPPPICGVRTAALGPEGQPWS
ncbi:MAG: thioredoxin family protein [Acidobacteria bacterium]|nr:thioredoxin family protein [Acidobacteriota bacterium]